MVPPRLGDPRAARQPDRRVPHRERGVEVEVKPGDPPARLDALPGGYVPGHQRQAPVQPEPGIAAARQQDRGRRAARTPRPRRRLPGLRRQHRSPHPWGSTRRSTAPPTTALDSRTQADRQPPRRAPGPAAPVRRAAATALPWRWSSSRRAAAGTRTSNSSPSRNRALSDPEAASRCSGSGAYAGSWSSTRSAHQSRVDRQLVVVQRAGHVPSRLIPRAARPRARAGPAPRR